MAPNDVLISGTPRSGTTLTCHLLNKVDDTVALHEPMRGKEWEGLSHAEIADKVAAFCAEQRRSLHELGRAISKNVDGQVPDNPHASETDESGLRPKSSDSRGEIAVAKPLSGDFTLAIKHNAGFTAALDGLVKRFRVYVVLRNPLSVVSSMASGVNARHGRFPAAERVDPELKDALDSLADPLDRQLHMLDWFYSRWHRHVPEENFIRYEDVVGSGGSVLEKVTPRAASLSEPLESRNSSDLYDPDMVQRIARKLLQSDGAYWRSYSRESVEEVMNARLAAKR